MSDAQFDAALDLLRRLNPTTLQENLNNLIELQPNLAQDLLSSVDVPLSTQKDSADSNREYLCCDYNRDIDSFRSPWSNTYYPELSPKDLQDSPFPSAPLRKLEILANDSFDVYRDLYYEGGISSVYLWDLNEEDFNGHDFAGVVLFKKNQSDHSNWDSIHVFEVTKSPSSPDSFNYRVTTTIILHLDKIKTDQNSHMMLSGNLTRQTEKDIAIDMSRPLDVIFTSHVANLGSLIEDIESQMRNLLETVYFEKTRDIFHQTKNAAIASSAEEANKDAQAEVIRGLQSL
ncbi:CLL_collapsed_G0027030.mRNA.1.CDS.1 [Saccharomyces cerevisiae]|uniref:F-actin-capping protein subunit beta n=1 Tax=Saccharomyces cerevisiae (strain Kyokai no. 7 / NBRC 101557) TaxID=721032 RepID=G2WGB2_YEASK|nr:ADQ_G0026950.mRNA.1.CDS.1 [Saccharomyces cerevisiae]GAA24081.1 K7_Cap2p [Saccharomyces cerevisiae Kyokai no. 7]CAI5254081.1 CLL_HP2_G0023200.mRNA.1.CDS.1 [Saccharomyces cerevisiae]CAI6445276.1 CLL_HP2_G0023200.mRNA.1.CDS.1 [Saccharomyces cerevisiae]CAI6459261.1 CLL_HP1_G0026740.mRNA.1.CDS.1 [Saccharomyces cerevisiae]